MKKFVLLAVAAAVCFTAMPALASVQNVKVYGNFDTTVLQRKNIDFNDDADPNPQRQSTIFSQTRLGIDADLTDNVAVTVGLINEREWAADNGGAASDSANDSDIDLYLAYVTLREMLYSPLTIIVGRQQWGYGSGLVFDSTGINNAAPSDSGIDDIAEDFTYQTSLDAFRAILDYNPLTIELFYAVIDQGAAPGNGINADDNDDKEIFGVYTTYALGDDMDSVVEAYFFKEQDSDAGANNDTQKIVGFRASSNPLEGVSTSVELAKRYGDDESEVKQRGYIFQFSSNWVVPFAEEYEPIASYTFTKASGDDISDDRNTAWSGFYEAQGFGTLYNAIFNLSNLEIHSVALETKPIEDVTATLSWHGLWKEKEAGSLSHAAPYGTTLTPDLASTDDDEVGHEFDVDLVYQYTEDVTIAANYAWFMPGDAFEDDNQTAAKQAYITLGVAF